MAEKFRVQVLGLRELGENLRALAEDISKKVSNAALGSGAEVVKRQAVDNAERINRGGGEATLLDRVGGHYIADNIITRRQRRPVAGLTAQYAVTVRHKGNIVNPRADTTPYQVGIFNEFGTVKMSAVPFMRPAFDSQKGRALNVIVDKLKQRIDKANKAKR